MAAFTAWFWGAVSTMVLLWAMGRLRGSPRWQPIWIGLSVVILALWAVATILGITLPVFETGTDPTQIPVAALFAPAAAAMLTALAGVVTNVFRQGLGSGWLGARDIVVCCLCLELRALERGGLQLVAGRGDAQQVVLFPALPEPADDREGAVGHRHASGLARLAPLRSNAFGLSPLDDQHRHRQLDEVAYELPVAPTSADRSTQPGVRDRLAGGSSPRPVPEPLEVVLAEGTHPGPRSVRPGYASHRHRG